MEKDHRYLYILWHFSLRGWVDRRTKQQNAVATLASSSSSNGIASRLLRSSPWLCVPCTALALHRHHIDTQETKTSRNLERWKNHIWNTKIVAKSSVETCAAFCDRSETMWWTRMVHHILFWDAMRSVAKLQSHATWSCFAAIIGFNLLRAVSFCLSLWQVQYAFRAALCFACFLPRPENLQWMHLCFLFCGSSCFDGRLHKLDKHKELNIWTKATWKPCEICFDILRQCLMAVCTSCFAMRSRAAGTSAWEFKQPIVRCWSEAENCFGELVRKKQQLNPKNSWQSLKFQETWRSSLVREHKEL